MTLAQLENLAPVDDCCDDCGACAGEPCLDSCGVTCDHCLAPILDCDCSRCDCCLGIQPCRNRCHVEDFGHDFFVSEAM